MKNTYVKDLKVGESISDELFAVKAAKKRLTKDGKPYFDLILLDKTGMVKGKIWSNNLDSCDEINEGVIGRVFGKIEDFNGQPQINVTSIRTTGDYDIVDFEMVSDHDLTEMKEDLVKYIKSIKNKHLKALLENIFSPDFLETFSIAPAAYTIHHAYKGGMAEHTLDIIELAEVAAKRYPKINRDLLITGALLHDIGKLEEYTQGTTIELTAKGRLLGHVYMGAEFVENMAPKDMPEDLLDEVVHMILSHQGQKEFGSPVLPKTVEAIALSELDDASFKINATYHTIHKDGETDLFTDYQKHFGTDLYRSPYLERDGEEEI